MLYALLVAGLTVSALMWVLWAIQRRTRDASSVDAFWALAIGASGLWYAASGEGDPYRRWLAGGLIAAWAVRLGGHLLYDRVLHARAEDGRYAAMRAHWGASANLHFAWFYQAQAVVATIFALPFLVAAHDPRPLGLCDAIAVVWWFATLGLVALADRQLAHWRRDPGNQGRTCRAGLWRWSRHPNYFFEWLHWFAYPVLALGGPFGFWTFGAPLLLLVFLLFLSGIPYTEARALKTRGDDYRAYQAEVSRFIPLPPRVPVAAAGMRTPTA
jgi:steroid 5-alpha reductase family enzyme